MISLVLVFKLKETNFNSRVSNDNNIDYNDVFYPVSEFTYFSERDE